MTQKTVVIQKDQDTGEHFFDLADFADIIDVNKVDSYQFSKNESGGLILEFFDKDNNKIIPKK